MSFPRIGVACVLHLTSCAWAFTQTEEQPAPPSDAPAVAQKEKPSPWMLAPIFSSNPKLGTSAGALGGYIHFFDEKSRPSIFALQGQYSNTDSIVTGVMARTSFDEDRQRVIAGVVYGYVKNDYSNYLGTGVPLQSNGELRQFIGRYLHRIKEDWFIGAQGIYQNFATGGETAFDQEVLDIVGVRPYKSGGAGLVGYHDSRDNENSPTKGWVFSASNVAYRELLGSDDAFDVYRIDFRYYTQHGKGNVFAVRQLNHLTRDHPPWHGHRSSFAATRSGSTTPTTCLRSKARSDSDFARGGRPRSSLARLAFTGVASAARIKQTSIRWLVQGSSTFSSRRWASS